MSSQKAGAVRPFVPWVLLDADLAAGPKLLYLVIDALSRKEGYCYASQSSLGRICRATGKDTIRTWLRVLEEGGWIEVVPSPHPHRPASLYPCLPGWRDNELARVIDGTAEPPHVAEGEPDGGTRVAAGGPEDDQREFWDAPGPNEGEAVAEQSPEFGGAPPNSGDPPPEIGGVDPRKSGIQTPGNRGQILQRENSPKGEREGSLSPSEIDQVREEFRDRVDVGSIARKMCDWYRAQGRAGVVSVDRLREWVRDERKPRYRPTEQKVVRLAQREDMRRREELALEGPDESAQAFLQATKELGLGG